MAAEKLTEPQLHEALAQLPGWEIKEGKLFRSFRFSDFVQAFSFMTASAFFIEKANHHPEWFNVYGRLDVALTTHDSGGITQKDVNLAGILSRLAAQFLSA